MIFLSLEINWDTLLFQGLTLLQNVALLLKKFKVQYYTFRLYCFPIRIVTVKFIINQWLLMVIKSGFQIHFETLDIT